MTSIDSRISAAWTDTVTAACRYYDLSDADAIEIALEKIEDWDYEQDPHGYCHDRSVLLQLVRAATRGE